MDNDLISRSALLAELKEWYNESKERENANYEWETFESGGIESAMLCVENFPAIDAEPVRHGKWLYVGYGKPDAWDCSECGVMVAKQHFYCPRCGARMDGGTDGDNKQ